MIEGTKMSQSEAIRQATELLMDEDESIILIGEGVPDPKGIFGTTSGLQDKFGKSRVFDSPLSENGVTGICIGAAISGLRPILVHQRIDFALLAMDQIVNNAAKWRYMFAGQVNVPLVIRVIVGRGWGPGPQHAQSLQSLFAHVPGLKVVMPVTPYDAKGMLISAVGDNNPVIFIEHRWLQSIEERVPLNRFSVPLDRACVRRQGRDVTLVAFSYMVVEALRVAEVLENFGIDVEVIDARSVRPLDMLTIVKSVEKTRSLVVADTSSKMFGIGSEVVAGVMERAFSILSRPPLRIGLPEIPVPTSHYLTKDYYPDAHSICREVVQFLDKEVPLSALAEFFPSQFPHDVPSKIFSGPF